MCDRPTVLDIGGEGRHPEAWNLNPRRRKTFGPERGQLIPRWIEGRGERIPLPDCSVEVLIVERTPLVPATLAEIARVASPTAQIILRHVPAHQFDPHRLAVQVLKGRIERGTARIGSHTLQETVINRAEAPGDPRGVHIHEPPNQSLPGLRDMTIIDPDGNKLRICTRLPDWSREGTGSTENRE